MRAIQLTPSEIDTLVAMSDVAPATLKVINCARGLEFGAHVPLIRLQERGLIDRKKVPSQEPLTEEERFRGVQLRMGKRPYMYGLTKSGRTVAHHLQAIRNHLLNGAGFE